MNTTRDARIHEGIVDQLDFEASIDGSRVAVRLSVVTQSGNAPIAIPRDAAETVLSFLTPEHTGTDIAQAVPHSPEGHAVLRAQGIRPQGLRFTAARRVGVQLIQALDKLSVHLVSLLAPTSQAGDLVRVTATPLRDVPHPARQRHSMQVQSEE